MPKNTENSVEQLLERAFAPIDPPPRLYEVFEMRLETITYAAAEELSDWELSAMRDPRNWVAPATAAVVGAGAGAALLVLHVRRRRRSERSEALEALGTAFGDAARELALGGARKRSDGPN
jgi:hypothetical protein